MEKASLIAINEVIHVLSKYGFTYWSKAIQHQQNQNFKSEGSEKKRGSEYTNNSEVTKKEWMKTLNE